MNLFQKKQMGNSIIMKEQNNMTVWDSNNTCTEWKCHDFENGKIRILKKSLEFIHMCY